MEEKHLCWGTMKNFHRYIRLSWEKKRRTRKHCCVIIWCSKKRQLRFIVTQSKDSAPSSWGYTFQSSVKNLIQFCTFFTGKSGVALTTYCGTVLICAEKMFIANIIWTHRRERTDKKDGEEWKICLFAIFLSFVRWCRCWNHNLLGKDSAAFVTPDTLTPSPLYFSWWIDQKT